MTFPACGACAVVAPAALPRLKNKDFLMSIKKQLSESLHIEPNHLNEISLDDIVIAEAVRHNIRDALTDLMLYSSLKPDIKIESKPNAAPLPCKSFWIENTKDLVLYIWNDIHSEAIVVPQDGWMIRDDITIH
jgi:hypothetical protein